MNIGEKNWSHPLSITPCQTTLLFRKKKKFISFYHTDIRPIYSWQRALSWPTLWIATGVTDVYISRLQQSYGSCTHMDWETCCLEAQLQCWTDNWLYLIIMHLTITQWIKYYVRVQICLSFFFYFKAMRYVGASQMRNAGLTVRRA